MEVKKPLRQSLTIDVDRLRKATKAVLVGFLCWAAIAVTSEAFVYWDLYGWLYKVNDGIIKLAPLAAVLILWLLTFVLPWIWRHIKLWAAWRRVTLGDIFAGSLVFFLAATTLYADNPLATGAMVWAGIAAAVLALRFALVRVGRMSTPAPARSVIDAVLGPEGLGPLQDLSEDQLERAPLLQSLLEMVTAKRSSPLTFGIEGPWGSGKTTLLNALEKELRARQFPVVSFSLWDYRDPDRLIRGYFDQLEGALSDLIALPGLRRKLYKMAAGLTDVSAGPITDFVGRIFNRWTETSLDDLRLELEEALKSLEAPVLVLIDDLDRLEADELTAVLRTLRLVGDLPNLAHVLAYDQQQVYRVLFSDDPTGDRARDFLGKILHVELPIGNPPSDLAARILEKGLRPLLEKSGDKIADAFVHDLQKEPISELVEVLPTPREIRRVAAATAWQWERMKRHLNLFDLFILNVIQYRFPRVYRMMRAHPGWFVVAEWKGEDIWYFHMKEKWAEARDQYLKDLESSSDLESQAARKLLRRLLPGVAGKGALSPRPSERNARLERRLLHPDNYNRYFHQYIPARSVTEAEAEDFLDKIMTIQDRALRRNTVETGMREEVKRGRIESFMNQLQLVLAHNNPLGSELAIDLAEGIARSADILSTEAPFLGQSDLRFAAVVAMQIAGFTDDDATATAVLTQAIKQTTSFAFAANIERTLKKLADDSALREVLLDRTPNLEAVRDSFMTRVEQRFSQTGTLLSAPGDDFAAFIQTADAATIRALVTRDLGATPELLPVLLRIAVPSKQLSRGELELFDLRGLAQKLPLEEVHDLSQGVDLEKWDDPIDRRLVAKFRDWIQTSDQADANEDA
ncbi:MAG: P-loop NTPase fold protein [Acidobacteriota bacterium]